MPFDDDSNKKEEEEETTPPKAATEEEEKGKGGGDDKNLFKSAIIDVRPPFNPDRYSNVNIDLVKSYMGSTTGRERFCNMTVFLILNICR